MDQKLAWPLAASATVQANRLSWQLQIYAPGPDLRYNGGIVWLNPEDLRSRLAGLEDAVAKYRLIDAKLASDVSHSMVTEAGWGIRVHQFASGLCIVPKIEWSHTATLTDLDRAPELAAALQAALTNGPALVEMACALNLS